MANYQLGNNVLAALIKQESGGNPNAVSPKGARGLTQIMPATAKNPGYGIKPLQNDTPEEQVRFTKDYMSALLKENNGDLDRALAAYNAGQGNVNKYNGIPPFKETQGYVKNIKRMAAMFNPVGSASAGETMGDDNWVDDAPEPSVQAQDDNDWVDDIEPDTSEPVSYGGRKVEDMSGASKFLTGVGNSVMDLGRGAAQITGMAGETGFGSEQDINESRQLSQELGKSGAGMAGNIVGAVAPALLTGGTSLPAAVGSSAAFSALQPTIGKESRVKNTAIGAATGAAGKAVAAGLGKVVKGFTPSIDAVELMKKGVQPTVGQGIDKSGALGRGISKAEEASGSLPFIGAITSHARNRALNEWVDATIKEAELPKLGITAAGKRGSEAITALKSGFNKAYDNALAGHTVAINPDFGKSIVRKINDDTLFISPEERTQTTKLIQSLLSKIQPDSNGKYLAADIRKMESALGDKAATLTAAGDEKAVLLKNIKDYVSQYRESALPDDVKGIIKQINGKYANFKRLERASSGVGAVDGNYSPAQLYNAAKALDKSKDKTLSAQNKAIMQGISSQGKNVLSDKLGDSGTASRILTNKLLAGGALEGAAVFAAPVQTGILGTAMLAGQTKPVQKALLGGYAIQGTMSKDANKLSSALGVTGANAINKSNRKDKK